MANAKQLCLKYFTLHEKETSTWKCSCSKLLVSKRNSGWTNLLRHINKEHGEQINSLEGQSTLSFSKNETKISKTGNNYFSWINWICTDLRPFHFVEEELTREYSKLEPICTKTLKKYMDRVTKRVEQKISSLLPEKFSIVLDGWTKKSTHFVAVFAVYPVDTELGYESVLLGFSPLLCETNFGAKNHHELLEWTLELYGKNIENNVVALIGDNAEVNKALANLCEKPLIGCASHKFNLAVSHYLKNYEDLLGKINDIMVKLKSLKYRGKLRTKTDKGPMLRNDTRWSSTFQMVERYSELHPFLMDSEFSADRHFIPYMLSPSDFSDALDLLNRLKELNSYTVTLQEPSIDLSDVRCLFDKILAKYPEMATHLAADASIIHCPLFESALMKIQDFCEDSLSEAESNAVLAFKKPESQIENQGSPVDSMAHEIIKRRKIEKKSSHPESKYFKTKFLLPSSNLVERFFSIAGFAFNDYRQRLDPTNLEMQMFLKLNKKLWDAETVSQCCVANNAN